MTLQDKRKSGTRQHPSSGKWNQMHVARTGTIFCIGPEQDKNVLSKTYPPPHIGLPMSNTIV